MAPSNKELSASASTEIVAKDQTPDTKKNVAGPDNSKAPIDDRKRIKTGHVEIQVQDLAPVERALKAKIEKFKGYLASGNLTSMGYQAVVKIPAESFESFLNETGDLGKVSGKEVQTDDVTNQFYDLENRIKNKRILQERFQAYLKTAKNVEELLSIERQLNDLTTEIEGLEGSFKSLNRQIDYSTLTLSFSLPPTASGWSAPSMGDGFADFGRNVVEFFYGAFFFLLYLTVYGIPIVLTAGLLWWLLFGKVGLVKNLFRKLTGSKSEGSSPK